MSERFVFGWQTEDDQRIADENAPGGGARPTVGEEEEEAAPRSAQAWARLTRTLKRIFGLRRLWAALGTHLKNFTELRVRDGGRGSGVQAGGGHPQHGPDPPGR